MPKEPRPSLTLACAGLILIGAGTGSARPTSEAGSGTVAAGGDAREVGRILRVGPNRPYGVPSEAAAVAEDGDTVEIDAGVYQGDVAVWRASRLTLRGVGGRAHLKAQGNGAEGKAIWVVKGNNVTVEGIEFSGARVPDGNGAGIRPEGRNLTVRDCYFHGNENGILAGDHPRSTIIVEHSVFADNGAGDGTTHNIYVNSIKRFVLRYSHTHHTRIGHNVKTRAARSEVLYNRINDGSDGTSSYGVDIANGGLAFVIGNVIQQGPLTENSTVVSYGEEGLAYRKSELYFVNNTVVNDRFNGTFVRVVGDPRRVRILNNIFFGAGDFTRRGGWKIRNNLLTRRDPGFVDAAGLDYRLLGSSEAINAGIMPGTARGMSLLPRYQYLHEADREKREIVRKPDLGAYEG